MPNKSGVGYADYVLYDDRHCPLAIIEAKRTCEDVVKGRQQSKLYADILDKEHQRRPVILKHGSMMENIRKENVQPFIQKEIWRNGLIYCRCGQV